MTDHANDAGDGDVDADGGDDNDDDGDDDDGGGWLVVSGSGLEKQPSRYNVWAARYSLAIEWWGCVQWNCIYSNGGSFIESPMKMGKFQYKTKKSSRISKSHLC